MSSFYEKLSMKFQNGESAAAGTNGDQAPAKTVTYNAAAGKTEVKKAETPAAAAAAVAAEAPPDGTDPLDVDLFQSDLRMVIFMQVSGIAADGFELNLSEESNTLVIEAVQKRPPLPTAPGAKEGDAPEKGIYAKQEVKWRSLYRKIYLPAPFDASEAEANLDKGVLMIVLPAKKPGAGKKLSVREIHLAENKK